MRRRRRGDEAGRRARCWKTCASTPASRRTIPEFADGDRRPRRCLRQRRLRHLPQRPRRVDGRGARGAQDRASRGPSGLLVAKELEVIDGLMPSPKRPMLAIMGGAKVSDKIKFINALLGQGRSPADRREDDVRLPEGARGGRRAARRWPTRKSPPRSRCSTHVGSKIILPVDTLAAKSDDLSETQVFEGPIASGLRGRGHRPEDAGRYAEEIKNAGTVIWNGPVGWFEQPAFANGTQGHCRGDGRRAVQSPWSAAARPPRRSSSSVSPTR